MQNIFWCHNKIYDTDLCCNLFFLRFILHLVNSDAKIDFNSFHYAKVFYEIDVSSLSVYYYTISLLDSLCYRSKYDSHNRQSVYFRLIVSILSISDHMQKFYTSVASEFPYLDILTFFTNLHILVCKRKITRLRSSVSLESFVSNSNCSGNRY